MRAESSPFAAAIALLCAGAIACSRGAAPPRVVSLEPRGTRAVVALGLADQLVAVDAASREYTLRPLPTATLETALSHHPDLVLIPAPPADQEAAVEALRGGAAVIEIAPHQFDEAFALYREIAAALGNEALARAATHRIGDPLARLSASSLGERRPLVAALVSLDPLVLAGGHSFESDLVEVAGAETLTHSSGVFRVPARVDEIRSARPELVLVAMPVLPAAHAQAAVRGWFAPVPVAFVAVDPDVVWLEGSLTAAQAIRAAVLRARE